MIGRDGNGDLETAMTRLGVTKTYKLYIDGKFPRSESGRSVAVKDAKGGVAGMASQASRKDLRDAASAARKALEGWHGATAYLRGQILYRMAEMLEGKKRELADAIVLTGGVWAGEGLGGRPGVKNGVKSGGKRGGSKGVEAAAKREVESAVDCLVHYAGWCDKFVQVLGGSNAVAGPYYNFTTPQGVGVVGVVAPDSPGLLGLVAMTAPVICSGNCAVVLAGESSCARLCAAVLGEVFATSDLPGGVVNVLTGWRAELVGVMAGHRDIDAIHAYRGAGGLNADQARIVREGSASNVKRVVVREEADWMSRNQGAWWIEPFVEMKTVWHPSAT